MLELLSDPIAVFLFIMILVSVAYWCYKHNSKPEEKLRHDPLRIGIFSLPHQCGDVTWKEKDKLHRVQISTAESYRNKALQKLVKKRVTTTPINNNIRITNYANDIVEDLELCNLIPIGWEPVLALLHTNGVCMVRYKKRPVKDAPENPDFKDVYFSTEDGHIIYFKR